MTMSHELVLAGIRIFSNLSSLNSNSLSSEFTVQDLGLVLEYAPNVPGPLPLMCIPEAEDLLRISTARMAPPELYMSINPIGAN